jgi:hypothetical protein
MDEDAFDKELESLESSMHHDEELKSLRRRFEESELWNEHKRYHDEQGGKAQLIVQEAEVPVRNESPVEVEETHLKTVRFGTCQCQPFGVLMQMDDRGDVVAGIPPPHNVAQQYGGLSASDSTTEYGTSNSPTSSYQLDPSVTRTLYR